MVSKQEILKCSVANFTKFGSKRFTLDDLASELGISKKTIYQYFNGKAALVSASVSYIIDEYLHEVKAIQKQSSLDAIEKIILIYRRGFEYLKYLDPAFLYSLQKYYPKADAVFLEFSDVFINDIILKLLYEAQNNGLIRCTVDVSLTAKLYLERVDTILFKSRNLFETYDAKTLLNHLIIFNLTGITVSGYSNTFFE
ncbi:TetR/AcrR family transcriptional regulator [Bizionia sp. KMM 8389]